jgi:crotonobetainyl-CoA:carnitine CoA-transferase CaiB-like acyl-CoA transferase
VLDLTQFLSGLTRRRSWPTSGAEIIKLEPPQGDPIRAVPPHFVGDRQRRITSASTATKRCVASI